MVSKVLGSSIEYVFLTSIESIIPIIVLIIPGYFLQVRGWFDDSFECKKIVKAAHSKGEDMTEALKEL
ncbi:hypothetical protein HMPREF0381_0237 [Lachnoanaerobaculum saburreum DSM 3986]|uniref:Uncharacterized protein n=1 Tax=Lachnoanaerobaculum saburreum DSM 3986 TaxID=887325 RepID=E6LJX4_9FIRM|nr:hypothetical protein HMPREF0381_0237 [Lachnoanaerobaculum saburreum DSM 3986]